MPSFFQKTSDLYHSIIEITIATDFWDKWHTLRHFSGIQLRRTESFERMFENKLTENIEDIII